MKIACFDFTGGGCDFYRIVQPMKTIASLGLAEVKVVNRGDDMDVLEEAAYADAFYFGRPTDMRLLTLIQKFKEKGRFVAIDFDDDLFNVSPWSPHYADHGIDEVVVNTKDGKKIPLWRDGVNINLAENRERARIIAECVRDVDCVTVTTTELAKVYAPLAKTVAVVPNSVDLSLWRPVRMQRENNEIRMGWAGGSSHLEDWGMLEEVLPEVMKEEPRLKLVVLGTAFKQAIKRLPPDRVEIHPWVPTPAYPYKLALLDLDFGIIPLKDTQFNRCKSAIKWIELASLRVPAVSSYVTPYKEMMFGENGIFVEENSPSAWEQGILKMAQDVIMRSLMGVNARAFVEKEYDIQKNAPLWLDAFEAARLRAQGSLLHVQ